VETQPIIIKRVKKKVHGHHGGAWKVAFADFAVAMMAFFMVMWLVNNTSQDQKKALAGYFEDPVAFAQTGGSNLIIDFGGSPDVIQAPTRKVKSLSQEEFQEKVSADNIEALAEAIEQKKLEGLMQEMKKKIEEDASLSPYKDQILLDITEEGLRVQIIDKENRPMFDSGSMELKIYSEDILRILSRTMASVDNKVSISGHTDAHPFTERRDYTNWELSAERANAARRALVDGYLPEDRVAQVIGLSSSALLDSSDPFAPINRRISIIVLNKKRQQEIQRHSGSVDEAEEGLEPDSTPEADFVSDQQDDFGGFGDFGEEPNELKPKIDSSPPTSKIEQPVESQEDDFGDFGDAENEEKIVVPPSNIVQPASDSNQQPAKPSEAEKSENLWDFQ